MTGASQNGQLAAHLESLFDRSPWLYAFCRDHLFRVVAVPAWEHTVELRYEARMLRAGTAIFLLTGLALLALTGARLWRKRVVERRLPDKLRKVGNGEQEPKGENSGN